MNENKAGTTRDQYQRRMNALKNDRSSFLDHWRDLNDYLLPRSAKFWTSDRNRGNVRSTKIIDGTATLAVRTLSAGLMSGVTNPSQPWFSMMAADPELNKVHGVKVYLESVRDSIAKVFIKSNLYTTLPTVYTELGTYGSSAFEAVEDEETWVRFYPWPVGSYSLGLSSRNVIDSGYREYETTSKSLVDRFGIENVSSATRMAYETGNFDMKVVVVRAIEPNPDHKPGALESKYFPYRQCFYEVGSLPDQYLEQGGYRGNPLIAPRWQVYGEDTYGISPGMEALADVMSLQVMVKREMQTIDKHVNPPLTAPTSLRNAGQVTNLPGGVTWVDVNAGQSGVQAMYQTQLSGLQFLSAKIREIQNRIDSFFYKDLFLMMANLDKSGITATEIAARQEEKLLALGPVYLRLNDELLDPLVQRTLEILTEKSIPFWSGLVNGVPPLPPPPQELVGQDLAIEYSSIMAKAMKAVGVASIERTMTFAGGLANAFPSILDNIDSDRTLRTYAEMTGTPPYLLKGEAEVSATRAEQAKQQAAQQALAFAQQGADVAKTASQASLSDDNALTQIMDRMGPGAGQTQGAM